MAKAARPPAARRAGTTKLHGRPLDDDGDIAFAAGDIIPATHTLVGQPEQPIDTADQEFVATAGQAVLTFLKSLGAFFQHTRQLEALATTTLSDAKKLTAPASMAEDETIQHFIKRTSEQLKAANAHWHITTVISGFHRRLTARRASGMIDKLEEANALSNRLHNNYVDAEHRRVAAETERKRRVLEAEEQAKRDEQAARDRAEADRLEAAAPDVKPRELAFINYYIAEQGRPGCDARAAQLAGYKEPAAAAMRLLATPKILAALEARRQAEELRLQSAAQQQRPLDVEVESEKPQVSRAAGVSPRTYWGAEVTDAAAFLAAVFEGKHGIPRDVLIIDESRVRKYGEQMHELVDRWPGVRHTKSTKQV